MKEKVKHICAVCALLALCSPVMASVTITLQDGTSPAPGRLVWYGATDAWLGQSCSGSTIHIVPEPATLSLLIVGGLGVLLVARRRR